MIRHILTATLLSAAPAFAQVAVTDPWARASILASRPGVAYLTLQADAADILHAISTPVAKTAMIHDVVTGPDGIARMRAVQALPIPAGEAQVMAPGGMHIMLVGLSDTLRSGDSFPLSLTFENAGEITVEVQVMRAASMGPKEASR
ncbi:hypothetical protein LCGC14_2267880 [marine sediment metagenome]|uniref:Copper chaperone PCu(A)C n=1 Tax=marine sediment metagenome TaxID=412755 RepID=A0A0F9FSU1_9ZZZZ